MSAIIRFEGIDIIANVKRVRTLRLSIKRDGSPQLTIPLSMNENIVLDFLQKMLNGCTHTLPRLKSVTPNKKT